MGRPLLRLHSCREGRPHLSSQCPETATRLCPSFCPSREGPLARGRSGIPSLPCTRATPLLTPFLKPSESQASCSLCSVRPDHRQEGLARGHVARQGWASLQGLADSRAGVISLSTVQWSRCGFWSETAGLRFWLLHLLRGHLGLVTQTLCASVFSSKQCCQGIPKSEPWVSCTALGEQQPAGASVYPDL